MSTASLNRRLSRLEADMPTGPACRHGPVFVMPGEPYTPCPVCGDEDRLVFRISVVPPVAPRSPAAARAGEGVGVGGQPPGPPDRPTGANRGD